MAPFDEQAFTDFTGLTEEERQRLHELHKNDPVLPCSKGGYTTKVHPHTVGPTTPDQPVPPGEADE